MQLRLMNIGQINEAALSFGDLTVLVGPQATGKSITLQFLKLMVDAGHVQQELSRYGLDWSGKLPQFFDIYFGEGMRSIWRTGQSSITWKKKNPKRGQRKPREIRELVIEIAKVTGFGYTRIIGELRKMGIKKISRQTVRNILKAEGIELGPDRTSDTWENFIKRHKETLWGCDFFSVKTVTPRGLRDMFVLVFLCLETREAIVSPATEHPNSAWMCEQADWFVDQTTGREKKPDIIMHDRDTKFTKEFTARLKARGLRTNALPKASPNLNGRCELLNDYVQMWECGGQSTPSDAE